MRSLHSTQLGVALWAATFVCVTACSKREDHAARSPNVVATRAATAMPPNASAAPAPSATARETPSDPPHAFDPPAELHLPSSLQAGEKVPLLLVLHGFGVSSSLLIAKAALNQVADAKKFAYLAPEGARDSLGRTFWNAGPSCCDLEHQHPNDLKRLTDLLDFALKNPVIDPARVFVIGYSNGGFMADRLACDVSDRLAGVISVAGAAAGPEVPCAPTTPLSVLEIHGDADPIVHYQGGVVFDRTDLPPHASALDTVKTWAQRLGCSGELTSVKRIDLEPYLKGDETEIQRYSGCSGAVELWTVHGGEHYVALQPPALDAMWAFMQAHPKDGA